MQQTHMRKIYILFSSSIALCTLLALMFSFTSSISTTRMRLSCSSLLSTSGISNCFLSMSSTIVVDTQNSSTEKSSENDWRQCIILMGNHMALGTTEWTQPNPCGFESRDSPASMQKMLFPQEDGSSETTILYFGDSLSQHLFIHEVNNYYPPHYLLREKRARKAWKPRLQYIVTKTTPATPPSLSSLSTPHTLTTPIQRRSHIVMRSALHMHDQYDALMEEIGTLCKVPLLPTNNNTNTTITTSNNTNTTSNNNTNTTTTTSPSPDTIKASTYNPSSSKPPTPNIIFMTFGNWDMMWKIGKRQIPGLAPGVHYDKITMEQVKLFWVTEADRLFGGIDGALKQCRDRGGIPPFVVLREQYIPNCNAAKFTEYPWTNCSALVVPLLVPFQRRILAATAWSYNIPVMPSEHMFVPGSRCELTDGIHLGNITCRIVEHQQHLETYRHLINNNVTQGRLPGLPPFNTSSFINVERFYDHLDLVGVGKFYRGQAYPVNYGTTNDEL